MPNTAAVDALILLAHEGSSEKRRELLHAVTDLFLSSASVNQEQSALFDDVMTKVASEAGPEAHAQWLMNRDAAQAAARRALSPLLG